MFYSNTLNLIQVGGGTQVKQGDLCSKFSYKLANEKEQELEDFDKEVAHINLVLDGKFVFTTTAKVDNSIVTFNIDRAIPVGLYFLEIKIRDYIFPSDKQTIIFVQSGGVAYDLKELVPNYDVKMTLKGILSDLSQKGIDIRDLNRRADEIINKTTEQLAKKANKDEVTNVMTPKGTLAYASLPTSGNQVGWYYYCPDGDGTHGAGNYVWNGTSWFFGGTGDEGYNLLKKDLDDLEDSFIINLADKSKFTDGYCSNTGQIVSPSGNYFFTDKIPVKSGETIYFNGTKIRFLTAYKNGIVSETDGLGISESGEYTVPEGVTEIVITSTPVWLDNTKNLMINRGNKLYDYIPYGNRTLKADKLEIVKEVIKNSNSVFTESLANGVNLECETNNIVKNKSLVLYAEFSTFDSIVVGHGFLSYDGSALLIDNTNVQICKYTPSGETIETVAHNLNISDFINISISVNNQRKANVLITTKTGGFVLNNIQWGGCSGKPFVRPRNCNLTNCKLTFACTDYSKEIWAFGDSYMTTTAPTRYPYYLYELGIDNYLLDAFGGRTSKQALESFKNALKYGTPKYLLWFLGMNDPDQTTSANTDWYETYNEIIEICKEKEITPIFATIPCTPTNGNWFKNRIVTLSGHRYVDFAKSVGASETGSSWNNGLLSGDKLHPTEMGAKVLCNQLLIDFNEIIN